MAASLRAAAGGVAGGRRRIGHRRGHLRDLMRLSARLVRADERIVRELARTLHSEALRALSCRRRSWLHEVAAGLAHDLASELAPRAAFLPVAGDDDGASPATGRCLVCQAVIAGHREMCFAHWSQVPRHLQRALLRSSAEQLPELRAAAVAAVAKGTGRVPVWHVGQRPAEFKCRPMRRRL